MKKDKIPGNEGAKNEQGKHNFFIKLIIVDIDSLFEFYLAIICFECINTLQILDKKEYIRQSYNMWHANFWQK